MATIRDVTSTLRTLIKQHTDDSHYSDEFLYHLMTNARSLLIERDYNKNKKLSSWNQQTYCVKLEKTKAHDCDCVSQSRSSPP